VGKDTTWKLEFRNKKLEINFRVEVVLEISSDFTTFEIQNKSK